MTTPVLECEGLAKAYRLGFLLRKRQVLHDVSLRIEPGEIFGFLGPNGAGKTTTIKIILGLVSCDRGRYSFFGEPQNSIRARARVGFLPDNPYFYDQLTGLQTLSLAGRMFDLTGKEIAARSQTLLERVALDRTAWRIPVRKYSRGMLQRLGLAQALIGNPEVLICDEPMEGLDPIGRYEVRDLLRGLREEGKTIFFSTHILSDVEAVCDRIGVVVGGRLHRVGTIGELLHPRIQGFDVTVAGLGEEVLQKFEPQCLWVRREGDVVYARLATQEAATALAAAAVSGGATLRALVPLRENLDEYFYELVREEAGDA